MSVTSRPSCLSKRIGRPPRKPMAAERKGRPHPRSGLRRGRKGGSGSAQETGQAGGEPGKGDAGWSPFSRFAPASGVGGVRGPARGRGRAHATPAGSPRVPTSTFARRRGFTLPSPRWSKGPPPGKSWVKGRRDRAPKACATPNGRPPPPDLQRSGPSTFGATPLPHRPAPIQARSQRGRRGPRGAGRRYAREGVTVEG